MNTFSFMITPLNEGQELNYVEHVKYSSLEQLFFRCDDIQRGLQRLLPDGTFAVQITTEDLEQKWHFRDGKFYNEDWNEIDSSTQLKLLTQ